MSAKSQQEEARAKADPYSNENLMKNSMNAWGDSLSRDFNARLDSAFQDGLNGNSQSDFKFSLGRLNAPGADPMLGGGSTYTAQDGEGALQIAKQLNPEHPYAAMAALQQTGQIAWSNAAGTWITKPGQKYSLSSLPEEQLAALDKHGRRLISGESALRAMNTIPGATVEVVDSAQMSFGDYQRLDKEMFDAKMAGMGERLKYGGMNSNVYSVSATSFEAIAEARKYTDSHDNYLAAMRASDAMVNDDVSRAQRDSPWVNGALGFTAGPAAVGLLKMGFGEIRGAMSASFAEGVAPKMTAREALITEAREQSAYLQSKYGSLTSEQRLTRIDELSRANYERLTSEAIGRQDYVYRYLSQKGLNEAASTGSIRGYATTEFSLSSGEVANGAQIMPKWGIPEYGVKIPVNDLNGFGIPRPMGNTGPIGWEPFTNSYPKAGSGGWRQFLINEVPYDPNSVFRLNP